MLLLGLTPAWAQNSGVLSVAPPRTLVVKRGAAAEAKLAVSLRPGYHVNSNTPAEDYLIPLRLSWNAAPFTVLETVYPPPKLEKYAFAAKPLSVYTGDFQIVTRFKAPADAPAGSAVLNGKLRYQACTNSMCLPPRTVAVQLPVEVR